MKVKSLIPNLESDATVHCSCRLLLVVYDNIIPQYAVAFAKLFD